MITCRSEREKFINLKIWNVKLLTLKNLRGNFKILKIWNMKFFILKKIILTQQKYFWQILNNLKKFSDWSKILSIILTLKEKSDYFMHYLQKTVTKILLTVEGFILFSFLNIYYYFKLKWTFVNWWMLQLSTLCGRNHMERRRRRWRIEWYIGWLIKLFIW